MQHKAADKDKRFLRVSKERTFTSFVNCWDQGKFVPIRRVFIKIKTLLNFPLKVLIWGYFVFEKLFH